MLTYMAVKKWEKLFDDSITGMNMDLFEHIKMCIWYRDLVFVMKHTQIILCKFFSNFCLQMRKRV